MRPYTIQIKPATIHSVSQSVKSTQVFEISTSKGFPNDKRSLADREGLPYLAEIRGHATHSQEPQWFTTAPIPAIRKVLDKAGWSVGDVDLFEINEAFAVVAMAAQKDLGISRDGLNINGGACALGHPIGATGARLIVTLLHALEAQNLKRGVAALCIGGGEATAIAVERIVH